jgi:mRNA interferase MazF
VKRGELYRVYKASKNDPKRSRVFTIVSRQVLIDSVFSTLICAPIYSAYDGLASQVSVGVSEGLKHDNSIHCDELISIPKSSLTDFVGKLDEKKMDELDAALAVAIGIR